MKLLFNHLSFICRQNLHIFLLFLFFGFSALSHEKQQDSTQLETLDSALVKAVRGNATSPITRCTVAREQLQQRNLGQDGPILWIYLPPLVITADAGAGVGHTGIRVRGVNAQSTNVT